MRDSDPDDLQAMIFQSFAKNNKKLKYIEPFLYICRLFVGLCFYIVI